jgi:hypothetical protein
MRIWAWLNHRNAGFVQVSCADDRQFTTDREELLPATALSLQLAQQSLRSNQVIVENPSGDGE